MLPSGRECTRNSTECGNRAFRKAQQSPPARRRRNAKRGMYVCLTCILFFFFCGWHLRERKSLRTLCFFFPWLYSPSRPLRCISVGAASEQRSSGVSGAWLSHRLHDNRRHGLLVSSQLEEGGSQPPLALPRYSAAWTLLPTIS